MCPANPARPKRAINMKDQDTRISELEAKVNSKLDINHAVLALLAINLLIIVTNYSVILSNFKSLTSSWPQLVSFRTRQTRRDR